jgi:cation:H+ antiporter
MDTSWLTIAFIALLFYTLGKSADLVIVNIKLLGERTGTKIFFLGLILGFLTSLPELSIGVNAVIKKVENLSLGNLFGGIIILFSLILGGNLIVNRKINPDGKLQSLLPILIFVGLPFFFVLDGLLSRNEGLILIFLYFFMLYNFYLTSREQVSEKTKIEIVEILKKSLLVILGLVLLVLISNLIVELTIPLLEKYGLSTFFVGLIIFSLGTNMPEITVMIRSWFKHISELSFSNILGSAMTNVLIAGMVAFLKPVTVEINISYYFLFGITILLLGLIHYFYENDFVLTKREGIILVAIYALFLLGQIILFATNPTFSEAP